MSVRHLSELQEDIDSVYHEDRLGKNETFRGYIANKKFSIPESFPDAESIVILATRTPLALVDFHHKGETYEIMLPPQYYDDGTTEQQIEDIVLRKVIGEPGHKVEKASTQLFLKRLAVRSGLGRYGRNNLCYVDGMGSLLTLHAYFTDYIFQEDSWREVEMMEKCRDCRICMRDCLQGSIRQDVFVIDVDKCVTLYNEIEGEFPEWIDPDAHNSLMGCMRCQLRCPANRDVVQKTLRLQDISEEETEAILEQRGDVKLLESLSEKLRGFAPTQSLDTFSIFTRNLRVLIDQ
ncbi:MAG: 4Fe-4S double cluster binding domain-containing protein [Candidatus Thorarchaeota archaeon]